MINRIFYLVILSVVSFIITVNVANKILNKKLPHFGICKDCNVILISIDTLRAKSLPCYGYEKNTAPTLCDFAKKSYFFKNSYSVSSYTLDSTFSVFTSTYPSTHKMTVPYESILNPKIRTIPQILKEKGYFNFYSGPLKEPTLPLDSGLGRDFDLKTIAWDPEHWVYAFDSKLKKQKFFAFLHTHFVHNPYLPDRANISLFYSDPIKVFITREELCEKTLNEFKKNHYSEFSEMILKNRYLDNCTLFNKLRKLQLEKAILAGNQNTLENYRNFYWETFDGLETLEKMKYLRALYETKIYELDNQLKNFFEFLRKNGYFKNTIVIIYGNHGEAFYEHKLWTHTNNLYNEEIRVPIIIYVPGTRPQVIVEPVTGIDIFPVILYLLGVKADSSLEKQITGENLFSKTDRKYLISQFFIGGKKAIYDREWKLIINYEEPVNKGFPKELYNLKKDPDEQQNIIRNYPNVAKNLEKELELIKSKLPRYE